MHIIHQEAAFVVVRKSVGLDSEHDLPEEIRQAIGGDIFPVHRLDLNVGGVMVYARNNPSAAQLSRLIQEGALVKEYVACVHGLVPESGDWADLLFKDSTKNKVFVVERERRGVKKARLEFTRLAVLEGEDGSRDSLVRIRLHTGRSHQIRVQFASRGYPLAGDHKYGARDERTAPMLHSCCLTFPWKGRQRRYEDLPDWEGLNHE